MKNLSITKVVSCLMFIAVCFPNFLAAQWSGSFLTGDTYRNGRVGINESSPYAMLQIEAFRDYSVQFVDEQYYPFLRLESVFDRGGSHIWDLSSLNGSLGFEYGGSTNSLVVSFSPQTFNYTGSNMIVPNGNIGIGTYSPTAKLQVDNGNVYVSSGNIGIGTSTFSSHEKLSVKGGAITTEGIGNGISLDGSTSGSINNFGTRRYGLFLGDAGDLSLSTNQGGEDNPVVLSGFYGLGFDVANGKMALCENGVLVIGGNSTNIDNTIANIAELDANELEYHLYVERGIRTERARVDLKSTWADYVFEEAYDLPKLTEVEQFIATNKHLPNVPSAAEVKANGIDVAQMDETLLRKIEELTLYTIEQQKTIEANNKELAALKAQMAAIQKALEKSK